MTKCLAKFKRKQLFDGNMIEDLITIIEKIPEDKFVEATLNIQPFKPSFIMREREERGENGERSHRYNVTNTHEEDLSPRYKK